MKKTIFFSIAIATLAFACKKNISPEPSGLDDMKLSTMATSAASSKKVLLVGIDGLQFEKAQSLNATNLLSLNPKKGFTGGIVGSLSQQSTFSGPGWMSILTGVWSDQHGVKSNNVSEGLAQVKSIFRYVHESKPDAYVASIATWAPINQFLANDMSVVDFRKDGGDDITSTNLAIDKIVNQGPDLIFVHLDDVDHAGHASGYGAAYDQSVRQADQRLGQMLQAVNTRKTATGEDWLVMVVTDHGRETSGYNHGSQTLAEKTIFVGMNKAGNTEYNSVATNIPNTSFSGLYGTVAQTSIVPTILRHLNISIPPSANLSSAPLLGTDGPRKLMLNNVSSGPLFWQSASGGNASIYRNNTLLATVPASQGSYSATSAEGLYVVSIDGSVASVKKSNSVLNVAAAWDWYDSADNTAYFFRSNGTYVKYNKTSNTAVSGYPQPVTNSNWNGLGNYANLITATINWDNSKAFVFLSDGRYLRYNMVTDAADAGYPKAITNSTWPGLGNVATKITASVNWGNGKAYFFLTDGTYIRYNIATDKADAGYPLPTNNTNWPGLGNYATKISAALEWNAQFVYFFLSDNTFIKYDKTANAAVTGYPKPVDAANLPGVIN